MCVCFQGCPDLVLKLEDGEEDLCEGLNLDNAPLNFDVGDDIIGCSSQEHIESDHTVPNCLLIDKNNTSVTASNFTMDNALEVSFTFFVCLLIYSKYYFRKFIRDVLLQASSPGQQDCTSYHQSIPLQMNINSTGLPLPPPASPVLFGQIHPTMSLTISNITGESSAADYQDCGMSPGFIMRDSPWESNLEVRCPQARNQAKLRYKEKKLKRS